MGRTPSKSATTVGGSSPGSCSSALGAAGDRADADAGQPLGDRGGQDRLSGVEAAEQPRPDGWDLGEAAALAG